MDYSNVELAIAKVSPGLKKYVCIMNEFRNTDVSTNDEFQKRFNGFYRIRQRSADFYKEYFQYMEKNKNSNLTYDEVISHFYNKFQRIEASFCSKLLATINPNVPVWDSFVLRNLDFKKPPYTRKDRLKNTVDLYKKICDWYVEFLKTNDAELLINAFDDAYADVGITDIKKVDLVLWQMR